MKKFSKKEYELFKTLVTLSQTGLKQSVDLFFRNTYGDENVISTKDYTYVIGDTPIALAAHLDTVHTFKIEDLFYDREKAVLWSPDGLGADDRAGVYSILEIVRRGYKPTVILTTDEEKGGIGAGKLIAEHCSSLSEINFIIELDRRGSKDSVYYDCANDEFETFINKFGFDTANGSFSDISIICPVWGVAGVNLSIGYYNEHTYAEFLNIDEMYQTIDKVCQILESETIRYEYTQLDYPVSRLDSIMYRADVDLCWECMGVFDTQILIDVGAACYCGDCFAKKFTTCVECNKVFEDKTRTHIQCVECRNDN